MKKILAFLLTAVYAAVLLSAVSFADEIKFTNSPKSVTLENYRPYVLTWDVNCELDDDDVFVLQSRENETWGWGNVEVITEKTCEIRGVFANTSLQCRIMLCKDNREYYSEPFTVIWKTPDDLTTAELSAPAVGNVLRGSETKIIPLTIKNTGKNDLRIAYLEGGDTYLASEIIENKKLTVLKPGESDSTSYSIRIKTDYPVGYYNESVSIYAYNLAEPASVFFDFEILDSDQATAKMETENSVIKCATGYSDPSDYVPIVIKNTGTVSLTNVRLVVDDESKSIFNITGPSVDSLGAGSDTGDNFRVCLLAGNDPGQYETTVKVYADGISEPLLVTIRGTVFTDEEWETEKDNPENINGGSSGQSSENQSSPNQGKNNHGSSEGKNSIPAWAIVLIVIASAALLAGIAACTLFVVKNKGRKG